MNIDLFHDTSCPWCRIGKRHLQLALAAWDGEPVTVRYRSFFLNPSIPPLGYPFREYLLAKAGGEVPLEDWFEGPRQRGAEVGLAFHFDRIERAPNTLLSHRLIVLTPGRHKEEIVDAIYEAYFEGGQDIGDLELLVSLAAAQGLDAEQIRIHLRSDAARDQVLADAAWAQARGVRGVPYFVVDNRLAFSGAQPPEVILRILRQATTPDEGEERE